MHRYRKGELRTPKTAQLATMVGTPLMARTLAVELYIKHKKDIDTTAAALAAQWEKGWGELPRRLDRYVLRHYKKFEKRGDVNDGKRTGRRPKLSKADVDEAAAMFAAGYDEVAEVVRGEQPIVQHHGFHSMAEALRLCPALEALRVRCKVKSQQLFRRMMKAHKDIKKMHRDYKKAFDQKQRQERREAAAVWLEKHKQEGKAFLKRLVAFDEGCIDIKHADKYARCEYGRVGDESMKTVLHAPLCGQAKGGITMYFYVIVNPTVGCVGLYFTTGTTDLKRQFRDEFPDPIEGFKVSRRHQWAWVQLICCWLCTTPLQRPPTP